MLGTVRPEGAARRHRGGGDNAFTSFTTSHDPSAPPSATVSTTEFCVAGVSNAHDGRSPPGAEITMRSLVPGRKV